MALHVPGFRIQASDVRIAVAREPDVAVRAGDEIVRRAAALELEAPELPGRWLEPADVVPFLPDEPDPPLRIDRGIARTRVLPRNRPLMNVDLLRRCGHREQQRRGGEECVSHAPDYPPHHTHR